MALLDYFFKARNDRTVNDGPIAPNVFYLRDGTGVAIVKYGDAITAANALRHPIIYRALNKIAESVQQVKFRVKIDETAPASERSGKATVVSNLQRVLDNPNENFTSQMFLYWMAINWACYGRVPFHVGFSAVDSTRINAIYPLEPPYTRAVLNQRGIAIRYEYGSSNPRQEYPSRTEWRPGNGRGFVDQIWRPGLKTAPSADEINSPLAALGLPAQVIRALLIRAIQTAEGNPNVRYMVTCSRSLTDQQKRALIDYFNKEHSIDGVSAGGVPVLQNAGDVVVHKLDNDLSDIHSKMPADDMARLIFGAFGIPIALAGMGAADGAKFANNFIESRQSFWQDTIVPGYLNPLFGGLTRALCPPGVVIVPNVDHIPAMQEYRVRSMRELSHVLFLTTNEKRDLFGIGPTDELPADFATPSKKPSEATNATPAPDPNPKPNNDANAVHN